MKINFLCLNLIILTAPPIVASTISVNFTEGAAAQQISQGTPAGIVKTTRWNNLSGASGSSSSLTDSTGSKSGAILTWKSPALWEDGDARSDASKKVGNAQLLLSYLDDTFEMAPSFSVSNLQTKSYTLILYFSTDTIGESYNSPTINGKTYPITGPKARYQSAKPFNSTNSLTIKNLSGNLTVNMPKRSYYKRSCIAGFQIIPSSPPSAIITSVGGISLSLEPAEE